MPFKYFSDVAKNEQTVKFIFDNVRNLGLVALVFGAAKWKFSHLGSSVFEHYFNACIGGILFVMAFVLMFINAESASHRIKELNYPLWAKMLMGGLYGPVIMEVINFVALGKS